MKLMKFLCVATSVLGEEGSRKIITQPNFEDRLEQCSNWNKIMDGKAKLRNQQPWLSGHHRRPSTALRIASNVRR